MPRSYAALALIAVAVVGCAKHAPEPTPHPSAAHITWSVAEGYGDKHGCKSTTQERCVLTVSDQAPNQRIGIFHLFLHAATTDTRYQGTVTVGFLATDPTHPHEHKVDRVVPRGSDPVNFSSTGIVKAPGKYYVEISLTAAPAKEGAPTTPIKERVEVEVK